MKVIARSQLNTISMVSGGERHIHKVICDGRVIEWVGIGWIDSGLPTTAQKRRLTHVIDGYSCLCEKGCKGSMSLSNNYICKKVS